MALMFLLLSQRRDHLLALFLDVAGEARVPLLDKTGCQAQLEKGDRQARGEVVKVRAFLREPHRLTA